MNWIYVAASVGLAAICGLVLYMSWAEALRPLVMRNMAMKRFGSRDEQAALLGDAP